MDVNRPEGPMDGAADGAADGPEGPADRPVGAGTDGTGDNAAEPPRLTRYPPWSSAFLRHAALWLFAAIIGGIFLSRLADSLAHRLAGILQLISALPDLVTNLAQYLAQHVTGGILHIAVSLAGVLFEFLVVAFFTFYMVALGPPLRRVVLSRFQPRRQRQILEVWEEAIRQTGGYFYSRLLIAVINGSLMFLVLWIRHPIDAIIVLAWIVVYQQIENYLLAPKLTAKTMDVSAPIAFTAALIGGALGGFLFAFLSLPVAGIIQSVIRNYGRQYEVIDDAGAAEQAVERT
jgi:predicted PurR-regulated permease PerM